MDTGHLLILTVFLSGVSRQDVIAVYQTQAQCEEMGRTLVEQSTTGSQKQGTVVSGAWFRCEEVQGRMSAGLITNEIEANGVTITYVDEGTGEPVVFVHGAISDLRIWELIRETLAGRYHFIAPTLRYFATGDWPDNGEQFSGATHVADLAAFIRALDIGPVHLVAWSYGADVAAVAALENPDLVQSLVLYEPGFASLVREGETGNAARQAAGKMYGPATAAVREGNAERATRLLIEATFQMPPGGFETLPQELQVMLLDNARTVPLMWSAPPLNVTCDMLKGMDVPTLIVHGAESNAFWRHVAEVMGECLPRAEVVKHQEVTHDGPVRDPTGLAAMIESFVARH